jgi:hypothetical protein
MEALAKPGRDARPARPRSRGTRDPTRCVEGFASASAICDSFGRKRISPEYPD